MSLRKSPALTPARIEANRRNAQKSTGPRSARGKAHSCLNPLKNGGYSLVYRNLLRALLLAPPCAVDEMAWAVLTPEQAAHPVFRKAIEIAWEAEMGIVRQERERNAEEKRILFFTQTKPECN
jgi:hypothetical protein